MVASPFLFFSLVVVSNTLVAHADFDNFPVKSVNVANAFSVDAYMQFASEGELNFLDAHPVHGIWTDDGNYVFVGKCVEAEGSDVTDAFAVKIKGTAPHTLLWKWKSDVSSAKDAANAVVQMPTTSGGGDLIVVGYAVVGGVAKRTLWKLSLSSGSKVWQASEFGDSAGSHGGFETVDLYFDSTTGNAAGIILGGFKAKSSTEEMSFKSYGNVPDGTAIIQKVATSALEASTFSGVVAETVFADYTTVKAIEPLITSTANTGDYVALLWKEGVPAKGCALVRNNVDGSAVWGPTDYGLQHGEGTDLALSADGASVGISGHGDNGQDGRLFAALTKVNVADATLMWTQFYNAGSATSTFIKNECWGVQYLSDSTGGGFVLGCGTGIENCNGMSGTLLTQCQAGQGVAADDRANAVPLAASVWQSLIVRTDDAGNVVWQRVDQFRESGSPALGTSGWNAMSSASEHIIIPGRSHGGGSAQGVVEGKLVSVNDEVGGVGFLIASGTAGTASGGNGSAASSTVASDSAASGSTSSTVTPGLADTGYRSGASASFVAAIFGAAAFVF